MKPGTGIISLLLITVLSHGQTAFQVKGKIENIADGGKIFANKTREIWTTPGQTIRFIGKGHLITTWKITNSSAIQQEADRYRGTVKAQLQLMRQRPVTAPWLQKMFNFSFGEEYRPSLLELYKRISTGQRTSLMGQKITANLFPPKAKQIGDTMADMPVIDTQLASHRLTDYQTPGKYLLLETGKIPEGGRITRRR